MSAETLRLSKKYRAFLRCPAPVEFLEGTTAAGKTTVAIFKFILRCADSPKKLHIIAAKNVGTAEKNIIQKDLGVLDDFGALVEYNGAGTANEKLPHILLHAPDGEKVIYVLGYGDRARWQTALGGQYGCLYIDEINTADIDFVREAAMRADYLLATLNPDDPTLPIYGEYINHSRPLPEWESETPAEIAHELRKTEAKPGWVHWFFSFEHNDGLSEEKKRRIIENTPKGTKIWKNKIEGLRGKSTGLVFPNFSRDKNVVSIEWVRRQLRLGAFRFTRFVCAVDTSYSTQSADTIALTLVGITNTRKVVLLDEEIYSNRDLQTPLAPSDAVIKLLAFLDRNEKTWGLSRDVYIDAADAATIQEAQKHKRLHGSIYSFWPSWKKITIIDRIKIMLGWIQSGDYLVVEHCTGHIHEMESYSWQEDRNTPEDRNDHTINSIQYAWIPYRSEIGGGEM